MDCGWYRVERGKRCLIGTDTLLYPTFPESRDTEGFRFNFDMPKILRGCNIAIFMSND